MKFFRIITSEISAKTKLKLPNEFVEKHGLEVTRNVMLRIPTGTEWCVEVDKTKDGIWLGRGLFKFAESLGIKYGHFLLFDYDVMDVVFNVVVIDMSATEIEYPRFVINDAEKEEKGQCSHLFNSKNGIGYNVKEEHIGGDDIIVMVDTNDALVGRKRSIQARSARQNSARKKAKASDSTNEQTKKINENMRIAEDDTKICKGETVLDGKGRIRRVIQGRKINHISNAVTEKSIERAKAFKAEEPVCIIALSPSHVTRESYCKLTFPVSFIKAYINLKCDELTLMTTDGRTWLVKYRLQKYKCSSVFTSGWKQFTMDNNLKAGDVCLFELINGAENTLKVIIFSAIQMKQNNVKEELIEEDDIIFIGNTNDAYAKHKRSIQAQHSSARKIGETILKVKRKSACNSRNKRETYI